MSVKVGTYQCKECNTNITGTLAVWVTHTETYEHIKNVRLNNLKHLYCEKCDIHCRSKPEYDTHMMSLKHNKEKLDLTIIFCEKCDLQCHSKIQYNHHLVTNKHRKIEEPEQKPELYECKKCNYYCYNEKLWKNHCATKKHNIDFSNNIDYECKLCDYKTRMKHHYDQHCNSQKHIIKSNSNSSNI